MLIQTGLHTCFHAFTTSKNYINNSMIIQHQNDIPQLMKLIKTAIQRPYINNTFDLRRAEPLIIFMTTGRTGIYDSKADECITKFNRILVKEAHLHGFVVLEREEIEKRLMFKSEHYYQTASTKLKLHLDKPSAEIIGTSLLALVSCIKRNSTDIKSILNAFDSI